MLAFPLSGRICVSAAVAPHLELKMPVLLKDIQQFTNGARFYTADLHIHSYGASADVKDSGMSVEAIIDNAVASEISIISITDHNSDKNVQAALDYAQKYVGQLLMLPGVEITASNGHVLAYFPPENPGRVRDLLARVVIIGNHGDRESHTAMSIANVVAEAERLGGISIAAHIDRTKTGFEAAVQGYPNSKRDVLVASGLYGLEFDDSSHLVWYSVDDEPTPDGAERKKLLNARLQGTATAARFRLAAMQNSDSHSVAQLTTKRTLTRFKMNELGFEGLRTALVDPEARVRTQASIPPSFPRILGMQTQGGFLDGETFHFSSNLNCFIGGRGTGKSTAVQALAYCLGVRNTLEEHDNCPESVVAYCEDMNGVLYRFERTRGLPPTVRAKEDQSIKGVPTDAFRVEFFAQGDLAEVAKNPLKHPTLLQDFLDRHIAINDLQGQEQALLQELEQNSAQLLPIAASAAQLPPKKAALSAVDVKLKVAETGKVKEIAAFQIRLAAEKSVSRSLGTIAKGYIAGISMSNFIRDYAAIEAGAGQLTGDSQSSPHLAQARAMLDAANRLLQQSQADISARLANFGVELAKPIQLLDARHRELDQQINDLMVDLQKKGLSGTLDELNRLIKQRTMLAGEVGKIEGEGPRLTELQERRRALLSELSHVRTAIMDRRKGQLTSVNKNLAGTIKDYSVNIYYEKRGVIDEFKNLVAEVMHGTYFQEETTEQFCSSVSPEELADLVQKRTPDELEKRTGLSTAWCKQIVDRFQTLTYLHRLETTWKPPCPIIKVLTKTTPQKQIPINQMSDGQKHTILLTVAMLAESSLPLIIDQPEDDLDNVFIFQTVVTNLRAIKEQRQVILVTHNANIAVLGDSELLFPMKRSGDSGRVDERGSVDRPETKKAVQEILEGGELAFKRRKEIYGH
jgi:DNA repair ATPase RecN